MNTVPPFPDASQASAWFYADSENTPQGPLPFADLQRLAAEGVITPETQVIAQGGQEWVPFARLFPPKNKGGASNWRESFVKARWVVIFFLLICPPLGLLLLQRSDRFEQQTKQTITSLFVMAFALMLVAAAGTAVLIGIVAAFSLIIWWKLQLSIPSKALATVGVVAFGAMMSNAISQHEKKTAVATYSPSASAMPMATPYEAPHRREVPKIADNPAPVKRRSVEESVAYKLASLDAGYPLNTDEPVIKEYQALLQQLSSLTGLNEEMISSRGWAAAKELKGRRMQVPALVLLKDTAVALSSNPEGHSFDAVLAAVTILKFSESRGR